ncbi:MAG: PQQ-binding-like beta-propeller repeat protein [Planctomycetota bacterium]
MLRSLFAFAFIFIVAPLNLLANHRVLLQGGKRLAIVEANGTISWEMKWGGIHDIHLLSNGNILTRQGRGSVVEIDRKTKQVIWKYDSAGSEDNRGKRVEVHAFLPLPKGNVMIAESGSARIIEVNRQGEIQKQIPLVVDTPSAHSDTRLVRMTDTGNYLVAHEKDGMVREYDRESGKVIWDFAVPMFDKKPAPGHGPEAFGNQLFCAIRLKNGNTLVATGNGHSVLEVSPEKKIVWQIHQNDLPNIRLAWVTTVEVLPNGNYLIGNCHAGPEQPILIEVDPRTKKVLWTLDAHGRFGNDVSNSTTLSKAQSTAFAR